MLQPLQLLYCVSTRSGMHLAGVHTPAVAGVLWSSSLAPYEVFEVENLYVVQLFPRVSARETTELHFLHLLRDR